MNGKVLCLTAMVVMMSIIAIMPFAAAASVEGSSMLVGKTATWSIDANLDENPDGTLTISDINVDDITENITCNVYFKNNTDESEYDVTGSDPSWGAIPLVVLEYNETSDTPVGIFVGVARKIFNTNVTIGGINFTVEYDKETGIMLGIYQRVDDENWYYATINATNIFFNASEASPVLIVVFIVIASFTGVYLVAVTIRDKKVRSKQSCFGEGCWDGTA